VSDKITVKPKSESTPVATGQENKTTRSVQTQLVTLCAVGLGVSFFLPWANFFGVSLSGFDLQKMGDEQRLLWLIPVFSAVTILAGIARRSQKVVAEIAGVLPFLAGAYWYYKLGHDLTHILSYGAFLSLAFGAALEVLSRKIK
jgi:hypothetical protein